MSFHDAFRAFRDFFLQVRHSFREARTTKTRIPGAWPTGTKENSNYQSTGASYQNQQRHLSPPSNPQSDVLQSLPGQYRQQQTPASGDGPQAVITLLHPANFWGDLVFLPSRPGPSAGQWQASPSLALLVNAIYYWAESEVPPLNEGGLSPQKVGLLLSMGEYANEHNIYALCEQTASSMSFGNKWLKEKLINQQMGQFYNLYGLSYSTCNVPSTSQSFLDSSTFTMAPPLLTREGYLRFILIGILIDPSTNFVNINKFLSKIPPLMNPITRDTLPSSIPRHAFPATVDPLTKRYVDERRQIMATMGFVGATANLQQGWIGMDIAERFCSGYYGFTSTGTVYTGDWIGRGI